MSKVIRVTIKFLSKLPLGSPSILLGMDPWIYSFFIRLTCNYMGDYSKKEIVNAASNSITLTTASSGIMGEYTTRLIVIGHVEPLTLEDFQKFPKGFEDYEFKCNIINKETCNKEYREHICNGLAKSLSEIARDWSKVIGKLRDFIGDDCRFANDKAPCRFTRTFAEEYVHSMIFSRTSMAALIDQLYWRLRLNILYITETLYKTLNMPRNADKIIAPINEIVKHIKNNELTLRRLPGSFYRAVEESVILYILKETYARLSLPFIEVPTWVSLGFYGYNDGSFDDIIYKYMMDEYFGENNNYRYIADKVYELSKDKKPVKIIEAANKALDPPASEIRRIRKLVKNDNIHEALNILLNRYETALEDRKVKVSDPLAKSTLTALDYALTGISEVRRNFISLMHEEPEVFRHMLNRLVIRDEYPESPGSVMYMFIYMMIWNQVHIFICGPINAEYGIKVRRTGKAFTMLEDLIGDGVIQFITMLRILENLGQDPNKEGSYLNRLAQSLTVNEDINVGKTLRYTWNNIISEIRDLFRNLLPMLVSDCNGMECYNLLLNRVMTKWPGLSEDYRLEFLLRIVESWILVLMTLNSYLTKLPEYHGMWA